MTLVVGGIALAILLSNSIVKPVRQLTAATSRVAAGDLDTVVEVRSGDELGVLAAQFNEMAGRIRQLRQSDLGKILVAQQTAEAAVDSLYDPVIVTDAEGRVQRINRAAQPLFGPEATVLGRPVQDVTNDPRLSMAVLDVLESQRSVASEEGAAIVPLVVDGAERSFRQRTTPMRDADNRLVGAVMLLEDITHLREIDRLKSEFIATASHELRTPLTSLEMGVHLLLEGSAGELSAKQHELLAMCRDDTLRLDKLVKDLLELSRIESGEVVPQLAPVPARELVLDAVEPLRRRIDAKGLALRVDVPEGLPRDRRGPRQDRARDHEPRHERDPGDGRAGARSTSLPLARGGFVAISVRDTGRGIPHDYLARVFEPFVQVPNASAGGAGLGLSISRRIVQAHGGQITVRSEPGQGTTFTFTLPVAAEAAGMKDTMRILVVDDEEHLRRMMRLTLEASGYEVAEAADGEEGLKQFGDGLQFDATLLDQRMPGMDGLETLRRMKLAAGRRVHHHGHRLRDDRAGRRRDEARGDRLRTQADDARYAAARRRRCAGEARQTVGVESCRTTVNGPGLANGTCRAAVSRDLDHERLLHPPRGS